MLRIRHYWDAAKSSQPCHCALWSHPISQAEPTHIGPVLWLRSLSKMFRCYRKRWHWLTRRCSSVGSAPVPLQGSVIQALCVWWLWPLSSHWRPPTLVVRAEVKWLPHVPVPTSAIPLNQKGIRKASLNFISNTSWIIVDFYILTQNFIVADEMNPILFCSRWSSLISFGNQGAWYFKDDVHIFSGFENTRLSIFVCICHSSSSWFSGMCVCWGRRRREWLFKC